MKILTQSGAKGRMLSILAAPRRALLFGVLFYPRRRHVGGKMSRHVKVLFARWIWSFHWPTPAL